MELLDTRQLRAFQELGRVGSFTAAAQSLHLTQSAVSHSIKSLETTLGVQLFERLGKSVKLTPQGEILLPHVDRIFSRMGRALEEIAVFSRPGYGRLRIGSTATLSQYLLPSVIREMRESFPAFEFAVTTDDSRCLIEQLGAGDFDLMIGQEMRSLTRFSFQPLFTDRIGMAMAPAHPLAQKKQIKPGDLDSQQFIFYNQSSETYRLVNRYFSEARVNMQAPLHMGSMAAIKEMAKIGMGIGLISPWVAEHELRSGALVFRDLPGAPLKRRWGIYGESQRAERLVEEVFAGICRSVMENLQERTERLRGQANSSHAKPHPA